MATDFVPPGSSLTPSQIIQSSIDMWWKSVDLAIALSRDSDLARLSLDDIEQVISSIYSTQRRLAEALTSLPARIVELSPLDEYGLPDDMGIGAACQAARTLSEASVVARKIVDQLDTAQTLLASTHYADLDDEAKS